MITLEHICECFKIANQSKEVAPAIQSSEVFSGNFTLICHQTVLELSSQFGPNIWIVDFGANQHYCNNCGLFVEYEDDAISIGTGNGSMLSPRKGLIYLNIRQSNGKYLPIYLSNVWYTPNSFLSTILEGILELRGVYWRGEISKFIHLSSGIKFAPVNKVNGL